MDTALSPELSALIGVVSTRKYSITARDIKRFAQALGDDDPLYFDEEYASKTRYGGIVAPYLFFQALTYDDAPASALALDGSPPELNIPVPAERAVGGGSRYELFLRARPGDEITVHSKLNNVYTKMGRSGQLYFIEVITEFYNEAAVLMARETATYIKRV